MKEPRTPKILFSDGNIEEYEGEIKLNAMKEAIGIEYAEFCETNEGGILIIDDSGKLKGLPLNVHATIWYKYARNKAGAVIDPIVGDVVYLPKDVKESWFEEAENLTSL